MVKIAVTGHRPTRLKGGYNLESKDNQALKQELKDLIIAHKVDGEVLHGISGMALGVDTLFAEAILDLKQDDVDGYILECAIPCLNQEKTWNSKDQQWYHTILSFADIITQVSYMPYKPWLMMKRNEYMVDNADMVIAVWDGKETGGTYKAVLYAKKLNKPIIQVTNHLK